MSLHYFVKYLCAKNRHAQEVIDSNCCVRLSHTKTVLKYLSGKISIIIHLQKHVHTNHIKNPMTNC